jgi:hypothetical protein
MKDSDNGILFKTISHSGYLGNSYRFNVVRLNKMSTKLDGSNFWI